MNQFQGLYPQDFQKAWPQAYTQALHHVAILHEQAGHQMASATKQVLIAKRAAETTAAELLAAKAGIVESIEAASEQHLKAMQELSRNLARQTVNLLEKERTLQRLLAAEKSNLEQSRARLKEDVQFLQNRPTWRRLWWALRPTSLPLTPKVQAATKTGGHDVPQ